MWARPLGCAWIFHDFCKIAARGATATNAAPNDQWQPKVPRAATGASTSVLIPIFVLSICTIIGISTSITKILVVISIHAFLFVVVMSLYSCSFSTRMNISMRASVSICI